MTRRLLAAAGNAVAAVAVTAGVAAGALIAYGVARALWQLITGQHP